MEELNVHTDRAEQSLIARSPLIYIFAVVGCLAAVLVFVLPFWLPLANHQVISASYVAGFNNRAAALAVAVLSLAALFWSFQRERFCQVDRVCRPAAKCPIGGLTVACMVGFTVAVTSVCAWALHVSGQRYLADAGYFIEQVSKFNADGGPLYERIEFAYGPLLFYPTVLLQKMLHCTTFVAYFATLGLEQSLGLLEFAYVLNKLPGSVGTRRFVFVMFAVGALNPLLGLNYTLFRYVTPVATLLVISNIGTIAVSAGALAVGEIVAFGISAEMGIAYAAGATALVVWKVRRSTSTWLLALSGVAAGGCLFALTVGRAYFHMLGAFAGGALNLPALPYPHILVFLLCAVWMAPFAAGRALASTAPEPCAELVCYGVALALVPSALGRCDPLHVFFNGLFFLVLSILAFRSDTHAGARCWVAVLAMFVVWQVTVTNRLFRFRTADTLSAVLPGSLAQNLAEAVGESSPLGKHLSSNPDDYQLDLARLERSTGAAKIATPLEITTDVESALKSSGHYQTSYYAFMVDTFSFSAESRAIQEMNTADWALVPVGYVPPFLELPNNLRDLQGINLPITQRNAVPFYPGTAMANNLRENWAVADTLGPYLLLRRRGR